MKEIPAKAITWFEITKDIILPTMTLIATVTLGTIIAILLKKREEKTKNKSLLIDNYMEFLNCRTNDVMHRIYLSIVETLKEIKSNYETYAEKHSNVHITLDRINYHIKTYDLVLDDLNKKETNWTPFTFKFCFLLGTKTYAKEAQSLENVIINNYSNNNTRKEYSKKLRDKIKNNNTISNLLGKTNQTDIDNAVLEIVEMISEDFSSYQRKLFHPYENKIADLIDSY